MTRVKRGKITTRSRRKLIQKTKGFRAAWSTLARPMKQGSIRSLNFSYNHRRRRSRTFRRFSILRTNALIRACGLPISYNQLINILRKYNCKVNRNILSSLGVKDRQSFLYFVQAVSSLTK